MPKRGAEHCAFAERSLFIVGYRPFLTFSGLHSRAGREFFAHNEIPGKSFPFPPFH